MRKLLAFAVVAVLALGSAACEQQPLGTDEVFEPAMTKVVNAKFPVGFTFFNPCVPEGGSGSGDLHLQLNITFNANNVNAKGSVKLHGSGESAGGTKYQVQLNQMINVHADLSDGAPTVITVRVRVSLVSQGSSDNVVAQGFLHITVNANGDVTSAKLDPVTIECRG